MKDIIKRLRDFIELWRLVRHLSKYANDEKFEWATYYQCSLGTDLQYSLNVMRKEEKEPQWNLS
jgi:hypothetical protein